MPLPIPVLRNNGQRVLRGVCFSPAGLLTPFHLGASHRLQQLGLLDGETALSGASGGALAAVTSALNVYLHGDSSSSAVTDTEKKKEHEAREAIVIEILHKVRTSLLSTASERAQKIVETDTPTMGNSHHGKTSITEDDKKFLSLSGSVYVGKQCRDYGTRGTLRHALDRILETILPKNIHEILNERPAPCTIAYAAYRKGPSSRRILQPQFISTYHSKEDVIDCLRASCNIPFYLNGNELTVPVRGHGGLDGGLAVHPKRLGCPVTGACQEEILVTPFRASRLKMFFNTKNLQAYQRHKFGADSGADKCKHYIISPDDIGQDPVDIAKYFPFSSIELMLMALDIPNGKKGIGKISDDELAEKYEMLFYAGEESVQRWYERTYKPTK